MTTETRGAESAHSVIDYSGMIKPADRPARGLVLLLLGALVASGSALAQGPPILTETPITTGLEGSALRGSFQVNRLSGLEAHGRAVPDPAERSLRVERLAIAYPFYPDSGNTDWVSILVVPRLEKQLRSRAGRMQSSGLGDVSLLSKYRFSREDGPGRTTQWTALVGLKLPTGSTGERDAAGGFLPPGMQPGSGSVDIPLKLLYGHVAGRVGTFVNAGWTFRGEGERGFEAGDSLDVSAALGYRLSPAVYRVYPEPRVWNLYLELTGTWARRDRQDSTPLADSGGRTLFLSQGLQLIRGSNLLVEASYQIPIETNRNGTQLRPDTGLMLGLRYLF